MHQAGILARIQDPGHDASRFVSTAGEFLLRANQLRAKRYATLGLVALNGRWDNLNREKNIPFG